MGEVRNCRIAVIGDRAGPTARVYQGLFGGPRVLISNDLEVASQRGVVLEPFVELETQNRGGVDIVPQQQHETRCECRQVAFDHRRVAQAGVNLRFVARDAMIDGAPANALDRPRGGLGGAQVLFVDHWPFSATARVCNPTLSRVARTLTKPADVSSALN